MRSHATPPTPGPKPGPTERPSRRPGRRWSVVIETVGGEGDGVAAGPVFVPFTLPGERVLAPGRRRAARAGRGAGGQRRARRAAVPALRRLRRLRPAALGPRALPRLEGRAAARRRWPASGSGDRDPAGLRRRARHAPAAWRCTPARATARRRGSATRCASPGTWWTSTVCPISDPQIQAAMPALKALFATTRAAWRKSRRASRRRVGLVQGRRVTSLPCATAPSSSAQ